MSLTPARVSLLLALAGCGIDNNIDGKPPDNSGFDSGTVDSVPEDTSGTVDTQESVPEPEVCGELDMAPVSVSPDESCESTAVVGTFTPVIEWRNQDIGDAYTTPAVGQLTDDNGDGRVDRNDVPDIVVTNTAGVIWVLSGDGGSLIWTGGNLGNEPMSPAIGDLDGDGWPEIVVAGVNGTLALHGSDGVPLWRAAAYSGGVSAQCGAAAIYDLDGDGQPEVVIGRNIYDGMTGAIIGSGASGDGSGQGWAAPISAAADIDQDGQLEVVVGNALYRKDGSTIWSNRGSDGYVAVANFDDDPYGEIVVTSLGTVRLQDDDGAVLWTRTGVAGSTSGTPTVADFDGDGEPEIGVAGMGQYIVLETDGSTKWSRRTVDNSSGFTGSSVFDFEGDGAAEVVYADENDVYVYDGATGAIKMDETTHSSATCSEYPAVADVDNDGHAEIIFTSSMYSGSERGVTVIGDADDSWMSGRPVWNQHAYAITNVNDDASIPSPGATNWLTYNNFRSGDLSSATGGLLPDAVPVLTDSCNVECADGHLYVAVAIANAGMGEIPSGLAMSAYSVSGGIRTYLTTIFTSVAIPSGESTPAYFFDFDSATVSTSEIDFVVDDDGTSSGLTECHEDNNVLEVSDGLCP